MSVISKLQSWIFHLLFPKQRAMMWYAATRAAESELGRQYRRKVMSLQRSPLDESKWVSMFVALDADYAKLEQEVSELRVQNMYLSMRVKELEGAK